MAEGNVNYDQVVNYIKGMSLVEAAKMVKQLEEELGVSAAAPVAMMAGGAAAGGAAPAEEQTEFTVILDDGGAEKVKVIKAVRELTSLGLKEAKDLVDGAPKEVMKTDKAKAEEAKKKLIEAGAKVTVK